MATYVVGDVQGCYDELCRLAERVRFDPARDRLWFTGDLVNRGPHSLKVLRMVRDLGPRATTVLGNHDLHLVSAALTGRVRPKDTFQDVLGAPDRDALVGWLRRQPLLHVAQGVVLLFILTKYHCASMRLLERTRQSSQRWGKYRSCQ